MWFNFVLTENRFNMADSSNYPLSVLDIYIAAVSYSHEEMLLSVAGALPVKLNIIQLKNEL